MLGSGTSVASRTMTLALAVCMALLSEATSHSSGSLTRHQVAYARLLQLRPCDPA
jgi:hypothetical protein